MMVEAVIAIGITVFSAGAAWGGAKYALNGTRKRVENMEAQHIQVTDRLARIETKLDILMEK
jgi:hypothetical protein